MTPAAPPAFVGREDALAAVTDAVGRGPALVLIEGEAGIGKSRLLYEALGSVADRTVLMAVCPPLREPFPLGAVADGLRRLRDKSDGLRLSALGGALRPLLPDWVDALPPALPPLDDPKASRHRTLRALSELVDRLEVETVVVEDANWADTATLEWLLTLVASGEQRLSIVVTFRAHEVAEGSLLLRLTSRLPAGWRKVRVELEPLDLEQSRRLVGSMLGTDEMSEEFVSFLYQHTDGVPLMLEETIRLMRERHDIIRRGGEWNRRVLGELVVPPTVRDSVLERVGQLPPEARAVLRAAAILAEPADDRLLIAVADLDERSGRHGIASGLSAGLLRDAGAGRLAFRHVLDARAVREAMPASEQWSFHRRAARSLQRLVPEPVVRLARHFREVGDVEAWCRYAEASAEVALESGDDRVAVVTLLEVLTSTEHPVGRRVRLARRLGEAAFFGAAALGELSERVVAALRGVLATADLPQPERGELRLELGRMLWRVGRELAAYEEFQAALPDLEHRPDLAGRVMANLAVPLAPDCPAQQHLRWLDQAAELVGRAGSASDRLALAVNRATTLLLLGEAAGWQAITKITESRSDLAEQPLVSIGLMNVAQATMAWGWYGDTRALLTAAADYAEKIHYQRFTNTERVVGAYLDWYTGGWQGLRDRAAELVESSDTEASFRLRAWQLRGLVELASGGRAAAEGELRQVLDEHARRGVAEPEAVLAPAALGRVRVAERAYEDALRLTTPVVEMIVRKGVWLWATDLAPVHVDALVGVGLADDAGSFVAQFAAGLGGCRAPAPAAALATCRAIVAGAGGGDGPGRAAARFAQAAASWAALPRPYDELLTRERAGLAQLAAGRKDDGLAGLSETECRLRELGARWDADRVAHVLRQHGVEVTRAWRRGPRGYGDRLSPRELDVVTLLARGMSNPEIATALFVSRKTVERHVSSAMRKLEVSSRTNLAMTAAAAGLLSSESPAVGTRT